LSDSDEELERINKKKFEELQSMILDSKREHQEAEGKPIVLTDANFSSEVLKHPLMVVDFWADWCGPCKMVAPIIEQLAHEYAGKVIFGKLDVDKNQRVSEAFRIHSIPTIIVFKNGKPVEGLTGAVPKSRIESRFKPYLRNGRDSNMRYRCTFNKENFKWCQRHRRNQPRSCVSNLLRTGNEHRVVPIERLKIDLLEQEEARRFEDSSLLRKYLSLRF
jgi:thioredoxin 1